MALLTPRRCVRYSVILAFVSFILINIGFLSSSYSGNVGVLHSNSNQHGPTERPAILETIKNNSAAVLPIIKADSIASANTSESKHQPGSKRTQSSEDRHTAQVNESLYFVINDINTRQKIVNAEKFPLGVNETYKNVIVVQVHNRDNYLVHLVQSLRNVRDIQKALLIISHDYYSKAVFDIVRSIDFMPVLQIFYPKSMQLFKDSYPGPDPQDCPRNAKKADALALKCVNAEHPDKYGHYREAAYSQTKLHWFWKLHRVFDELAVTWQYEGMVTLIEEDHYLTPDSLYMLNFMASSNICPKCKIFTVGNYDKKPSYTFYNEVVIAPDFISSKHNMAMSFNRTVYNTIKEKAKEFCEYDDYNWDWSLQYLGKEQITGKFPTLIVKTPRVYHIGECGVHHKGKKCNPLDKTTPIEKNVEINKEKLFPSQLKIGRPTSNTYLPIKKMKPNGGWGDIRDHELCQRLMEN